MSERAKEPAIFSEGIEIGLDAGPNGVYAVRDIATGHAIAGVIDWQLVDHGDEIVSAKHGGIPIAAATHHLVELEIDSMGTRISMTMPAYITQSDRFDALHREITSWQRETFPGGTIDGAAAYLVDEVEELRDAIFDSALCAEELADVYLLTVACAHLLDVDLYQAARDKLAINRERTWETSPGEHGYRKHIESETAS